MRVLNCHLPQNIQNEIEEKKWGSIKPRVKKGKGCWAIQLLILYCFDIGLHIWVTNSNLNSMPWGVQYPSQIPNVFNLFRLDIWFYIHLPINVNMALEIGYANSVHLLVLEVLGPVGFMCYLYYSFCIYITGTLNFS